MIILCSCCSQAVTNIVRHYEAAHGGVPAARVLEPFVLRPCAHRRHGNRVITLVRRAG